MERHVRHADSRRVRHDAGIGRLRSRHAHVAARRLALTVLVLAVSLLFAEYAARIVFRRAHSSGRAGDFVATHGGGPPVVINSLGFREREVLPKNPRIYRIAVVGDSFTWGQGIEARQRFSNLIQDSLGPGYEVLNFGRPGDDMPEHLGVLEQALQASPDFVLLQLYINDFETKQMQRPRPHPLLPASIDRSLERSSVLYDLMNQEWGALQPHLGLVDSYEEYMAKNLHDPSVPNAQLAFGMLNQFIVTARRAGVASGTVLFPAPDAMGPHGSHYPFGYLHERVAAHVRQPADPLPGSAAGVLDHCRSADHVGQPVRRPPQPDGQRARRPGDPPAVPFELATSDRIKAPRRRWWRYTLPVARGRANRPGWPARTESIDAHPVLHSHAPRRSRVRCCLGRHAGRGPDRGVSRAAHGGRQAEPERHLAGDERSQLGHRGPLGGGPAGCVALGAADAVVPGLGIVEGGPMPVSAGGAGEEEGELRRSA